jgi:hypothetical protein
MTRVGTRSCQRSALAAATPSVVDGVFPRRIVGTRISRLWATVRVIVAV